MSHKENHDFPLVNSKIVVSTDNNRRGKSHLIHNAGTKTVGHC